MQHLFSKPDFRRHRLITGAPVAVDATDLVDLRSPDAIPPGGGAAVATPRRDIVDSAGWLTANGVVKLTGGTTPTVTLQVLEDVDDGDGDVPEFYQNGTDIGPLSDGDMFEVTPVGGRFFIRLSAQSGDPTAVEILLAGSERQPGEVGQLRSTVW